MTSLEGKATQNGKSVKSIPKFKVILLGESGVGKTSLFLRVKDNEFRDKTPSSIGIDSCFKRFKLKDNTEVQICLWDTAGVERFRTLTRNFYRNAQAVMMVFSVNEPSTLYYLSKWEQDVTQYAPSALKFLIGNKKDQEHLTTQESIESFATSHNCEYAFLTSAKTGEGVLDSLSTVSQTLVSYHTQDQYLQENSWLAESIHVNQGTDPSKGNSTGCC